METRIEDRHGFTGPLVLAIVAALALGLPPVSSWASQGARKAGGGSAQNVNRRPSSRQAGSPDGEGHAQFLGDTSVRVGQAWAGAIEFTVGPSGIARGGGIRAFTPPTAWDGPPAVEGTIQVSPPTDSKPHTDVVSRQVQGWIVVASFPDGPLTPGSRIRFHYSTRFVQKYSERELIWPVESDVDGDGKYALLEDRSQPRLQVVAGPPARLRIGAPSLIESASDIAVRILVMDDLNNPVEQEFSETVSLKLAEASTLLAIHGNRGQAKLPAPAADGLYILTASATGLETCHLPVKVVTRKAMSLYWGLLHAHTRCSDGLGTLDEYYTYGRDVGFLDFCAANDHAWQLDRQGLWQQYISAAQRYNDPGRYATLVGYEWTAEGHRNVYFATADADLPLLHREKPREYDQFVAELKRSGKRVIIGKHTGHPVDTRKHDAAFERLVEIQSMWGTSEYPGCPGWTKGSEKFVPAGSGQTLLGSGHHVAFVGGGDSHSGRPGRNWYGTRWGPLLRGREGLTAVLAPELNREAVFSALDRLHCYATSGPRILVDFRAGRQMIGDRISANANPAFTIDVGGTTELARIELLRDNYVITLREPKAMTWSGSIEDSHAPAGEHWYYVRVTQTDGERAWTTPIWVTRR